MLLLRFINVVHSAPGRTIQDLVLSSQALGVQYEISSKIRDLEFYSSKIRDLEFYSSKIRDLEFYSSKIQDLEFYSQALGGQYKISYCTPRCCQDTMRYGTVAYAFNDGILSWL